MDTYDIAKAIDAVYGRIKTATSKRSPTLPNQGIRLVAVSKTKPKEMIIEAYKHGQRHFGENYVGELVDKASDLDIAEQCPDIKWHFIGHLQSNKVNKLLSAPNLYVIETIDSEKLANTVNKSWEKLSKPASLKVMAQVNTSHEPNKSGVAPEKVTDLVSHILTNCSNLEMIGIMTIGAYEPQPEEINPDFQLLLSCRKNVCEKLALDLERIEVSMGMSHDFEHAIEMGSTNVRVGSSIFGARNYSQVGDTASHH